MLDVAGRAPHVNTVRNPATHVPLAVTLSTTASASFGTMLLTSTVTVRPGPSIPPAPPRVGSRVSRTRLGVNGTKPDAVVGTSAAVVPLSNAPVRAFVARHLPMPG